MVRSAGIVSIAVATSRVTGLVREILLAAMFGAGAVFDAFRIAFTIPNLTRDLFAEGALSAAFVPVFTRYLSSKPPEEARVLANLVATSLIVIVGAFCLLGIVLSPQLVALVAPGFKETPGKYELAVTLTRVMFPFLLLVALSAQAMGILNACNQFGVPAISSTFYNIGSVVAGLFLGKVVGPTIGLSPIAGMAYGVVIGGAMQLLWQVPSLHRAGFRFRPKLDWSHPGLRQIFALMGPAILGNAAVQINVTVNNNFASRLEDPNGPVSWLGYAFRFMQLPLGIFGVAIASATLPSISRSAAAQNFNEFRETLSRSLGLVFALTIPSAVGLAVLGDSIVGAVYQMGEFTAADTHQTARALACYAFGLVGYSAAKVLNPAFYALHDSRTPMLVSFASIAVNLLTVTALLNLAHLGHEGLALSTSAVAVVSSIALFIIMRNRVGGIYGRNLWRTFLRVSFASALMGAVVWCSTTYLGRPLGTSKLARVADLAVSIPLGMAVLYAAYKALRITELDSAIGGIAGPLQRALPFLRARISKQ
ncbi:MAG TPA: murein biosynthesis integral membrane protein MurJ [Bryobacteraceae bacterium]|nr:murein biosynthesis integral membrane protein MurJ [Bryobacteraceae bacterium]